MNSSRTDTSDFEDVKVNIKIKISALWTSVTLCYLYGDYFELYVPQKTQGLVNGLNMLDSPIKLFAASVLLAIPALMVFLSVLLNPTINRRLNIIIGVFFTAIDNPLADFLCIFSNSRKLYYITNSLVCLEMDKKRQSKLTV
jgi:hypothetical protein